MFPARDSFVGQALVGLLTFSRPFYMQMAPDSVKAQPRDGLEMVHAQWELLEL